MSLSFGDCNAQVMAVPGMPGSAGVAVSAETGSCSAIAVGVPGIPGSSASASTMTITGTAAQALSGHAAVYRRTDGLIDYASADDVACMRESIWVTLGAASMGDDVTCVIFGEMSEGSWTWTPNSLIFLGLAGALTQTVPSEPTSDFLRVMGYAPLPTKMFVNSQPAIDLI
jgi:hypothetical protein